MRLKQMESFLMVAEIGNITKAADLLYISQSALSQQLSLLEEELGVSLMHRSARGIVLTEAGEQFEQDCKRIFEELEQAVKTAKKLNQKTMQALRIACFDGAAFEEFMRPLYDFFQKEEPHLQIKLTRSPIHENRKAFDEGKVDLLIELLSSAAQDHIQKNEYCHKLICHRKRSLIINRNAAVYCPENMDYEQLAQETYLMTKEKEGRLLAEPTLQYIRKQSNREPCIEVVDNMETLISNIKMGYGYSGLAPKVADSSPILAAIELPEELGVDVVAVWKKENTELSLLMGNYHPNLTQK